jgi:hypothetical protein
MIGNAVLAAGDSRTIFCVAAIGAVATVGGLLVGFHAGGMTGAFAGFVLGRLVPLPYLLAKSIRIFGTGGTLYDVGWILFCAAATAWAFSSV